MKFMGWGIRQGDEGVMTGISSGFREPNGIGTFGPNRDIFVTDKQGHWTAVCELNHLRPDKYFGRPSATPDPNLYGGRGKFTPPAVWFPTRWPSPSRVWPRFLTTALGRSRDS